MTGNRPITVISRSYDQSVRRKWNCRLVERNGSLLTLEGVFENTVDHADLGQIVKGTVSYEYFWLDRWFNVFRFHEPDGDLRNFYCNVSMPPIFDGTTLEYVDLDIDLIVWPDARVVTLDEDDFAANSEKYGYPDNVQQEAFEAIERLNELIFRREFPFDSLCS